MNPGGPERKPRRSPGGRALLPVVLLALMVAVSYKAVPGHDFVNLDDGIYVTQNRVVQSGLSAAGIVWAFSTFETGNWHPLTWLSHMTDVELFGLRPGGQHLMSVILHLVNTLLLYLVLRGMTGEPWPGFFVVALFAVHPLHVESVAWIAERKDVLSALFWLLTMAAYLRYVRRPGKGRYALVVLPFALGLMAKPMLVTLPLILLLLDYWPLGRLASASADGETRVTGGPGVSAWFLAWEKAPLAALAVVTVAVTYVAQRSVGAVMPLESYPPLMRGANAVLAYGRYVMKTFLPSDLAAYYPLSPADLTPGRVTIAALFLLCLSALIYRGRKILPSAVVGWAWFLITLLPVIGLVQIGNQSMADRYTYLPLIGLFLAVVWPLSLLPLKPTGRRPVAVLTGGAILVALMTMTMTQAAYWRDSVTLWEHTLAVTRENWLAHIKLGTALYARRDFAQADDNLEQALLIDPGSAEAHCNLGISRAREGRVEEAMAHFAAALAQRPNFAEAHFSLGTVLMEQGRKREAMEEYAAALAAKPDYPLALNNLGFALLEEGDAAGALPYFSRAVELQPNHIKARFNLADALNRLGRKEEAAAHYREAMKQRSANHEDRVDSP